MKNIAIISNSWHCLVLFVGRGWLYALCMSSVEQRMCAEMGFQGLPKWAQRLSVVPFREPVRSSNTTLGHNLT